MAEKEGAIRRIHGCETGNRSNEPRERCLNGEWNFVLCALLTLRDTCDMFKRMALVAAVAFVFFLGLLAGFFFLRLSNGNRAEIRNTSTLLKQIQTISELSTVKYVFEKLVILEVPPETTLGQLFAGESRVMLVAHGIVKGGIDFQKIGASDFTVSGKTISIKLPPALITDAYLDDTKTQILERKTGFLRTFDRDLEQNARRQAVDDLKRAARNNGILKEAEERARSQISNLFHQLGFTEVEFR